MISVILILLALIISNVMTTSLNILAISGILLALIYKWHKIFTKKYTWYLISLVLAVLAVIFNNEPITFYITKGYISFAVFFVVMFTGVLPNQTEFSRKLKKVRGLLSIIGFILITPHAALHIFQIYNGINLFGIVAYALMVPLTVISFDLIKKEMSTKDWKTVQKGAYVIYIAIFIHLLLVGLWIDKVIYAVLLTLYLDHKLLKEFKK